jgi:predicted metal-dependent hydrolase
MLLRQTLSSKTSLAFRKAIEHQTSIMAAEHQSRRQNIKHQSRRQNINQELWTKAINSESAKFSFTNWASP